MDREKIVSCLTDIENIMIVRQEICPREELQYWIELQEGVADALAILKQEAVDMEIEGGGHSWWYVCEECRGTVDTSDRFCRHCGRPFRKRKCAGCKDDCPQTGNFVCPNGKL